MVLESGLALAIYIIAAVALLPLALLFNSWHTGKMNDRQGWRLRRVVSGRWAYEEKMEKQWVGIPFEELLDFREPPYVIVAPSEDTWRTFPAWAHKRRAEIIERVRSGLKSRNYVVEMAERPSRLADLSASPRSRGD
jgi:hypothetical protein